MDTNHVAEKFERMGARVQLRSSFQGRFARSPVTRLEVDIRRDRKGEYFDISLPDTVELQVLDARPSGHHLLLLARVNGEPRRFLCGHDERHWFVSAVPGEPSTVFEAKEALKPEEVREAERRLKPRARERRRNAARVRQGEWFFIPAPRFRLGPEHVIVRDEPIARMDRDGRLVGNPHRCEEVIRFGGTRVHVPRSQWMLRMLAEPLTEEGRAEFLREHPQARDWAWDSWLQDPEVYARGRVRHPDHRTIRLRGWHKVVMNTESRAAGMEFVRFVD